MYEKILEKIGIAFQIKDDLLGLYSENDSMGKTLNDIKDELSKRSIIDKKVKQESINNK